MPVKPGSRSKWDPGRTKRTSQVPGNLQMWIVATTREAGWVPVFCLLLLVVPSRGFDLFTRFPDIDIPLHFVGGIATAFFFHRLSINASQLGVLGPFHVLTHIALVFGLLCMAAVFWEFAEFFSDSLFGTHAQLSNQDTMSDLLAGLSGGATFLSVYPLLRRYPW